MICVPSRGWVVHGGKATCVEYLGSDESCAKAYFREIPSIDDPPLVIGPPGATIPARNYRVIEAEQSAFLFGSEEEARRAMEIGIA